MVDFLHVYGFLYMFLLISKKKNELREPSFGGQMRMLSPSRPNGCSQQIDGSVQTRLAQGRRGKGTRGRHLGTDYSTWGRVGRSHRKDRRMWKGEGMEKTKWCKPKKKHMNMKQLGNIGKMCGENRFGDVECWEDNLSATRYIRLAPELLREMDQWLMCLDIPLLRTGWGDPDNDLHRIARR